MESLLPIIIQLISGAAGGNIVGKLAKNLSLGTVGNSLAGVVGGGIGGQILNSMLGGTMNAATTVGTVAAAPGAFDTIIQDIAGGGIGGGVLMAVIGLVRSMMAK